MNAIRTIIILAVFSSLFILGACGEKQAVKQAEQPVQKEVTETKAAVEEKKETPMTSDDVAKAMEQGLKQGDEAKPADKPAENPPAPPAPEAPAK